MIELIAEPSDALIDAQVRISVTGAAPAELVLRAALETDDGARWVSQTPLAELARDSMRWAWSMSRTDAPSRALDPFAPPAPARVTLECLIAGRTVATGSVLRRFVPADAIVERVSESGLVGVLIRPPATRPLPAVIVLSGGGGGLNLPLAAMLAAHGYAAFALGWYAMPGLPSDLVEIPLEYLERGLTWLAAHPAVDPARVAVEGRSKGGELALLLGATFPQIRAVVALSPSSLTHGWLVGESHRACWTWRGEPLPYTPVDRSRNRFVAGQPLSIRPGYEATLEDPERMRVTAIPVERTCGGILLISGEDDRMWPSTPFCELAVARLEKHGFAHRVTHLCCAGAGHEIGLPNLPTHSVPGEFFAMGGTPEANARASEDAWRAILEFLARELAG